MKDRNHMGGFPEELRGLQLSLPRNTGELSSSVTHVLRKSQLKAAGDASVYILSLSYIPQDFLRFEKTRFNPCPAFSPQPGLKLWEFFPPRLSPSCSQVVLKTGLAGIQTGKPFLWDFLSGFTSPRGLENNEDSSKILISACLTHGRGSVLAEDPKPLVLRWPWLPSEALGMEQLQPSWGHKPGKRFVFQSSPWAMSQERACVPCLTWHSPGPQHLSWFKCSALSKTLSKKQGASNPFLLPQIPLVPAPLKHASSQTTCPILHLYSQRKLLAAFFGVSFSCLRPSHANKDLFFSDQNNIKEKILSHD